MTITRFPETLEQMTIAGNYVGQKHGRLTVGPGQKLWTSPSGEKTFTLLECNCECGGQTYATITSLKSGNTGSCGCLKIERIKLSRTTHGHNRPGRKTRTYNIWALMRQRITSPTAGSYNYYGGRGIKCAERWSSYENFLEDMGECPEGLSLDRIDVNGNYEPGNCRWVTHKEQCQNKTNSRFITVDGETLTISIWSDRTGLSFRTIASRLRLGWPPDKAVKTPSRKMTGYGTDIRRITSRMARQSIPLLTKLASALLHLKRGDGTWVIPEHLRDKGAATIVAHVQWDHNIPHAIGGADTPQNLQPLPKADHLEKTRIDVGNIAKGKRLSKAEDAFRQRLLAKSGQGEFRTYSKFKRAWPKGRKIQSRPFQSRKSNLTKSDL